MESEIRDIKLKLLTGELSPFSVKVDAVSEFSNCLDFLSSEFSDVIISGSLALNLFGLINRDVKDLDIIVDKSKVKDDTFFEKDSLYGFGGEIIENRLGLKSYTFKHSWYKKRIYVVDFFILDKQTYIEFDYNGVKLKLHNPLEIFKTKIEMIDKHLNDSTKHLNDLLIIFKNLK